VQIEYVNQLGCGHMRQAWVGLNHSLNAGADGRLKATVCLKTLFDFHLGLNTPMTFG
jgi:hypothetical protein